MAFPDLIKNQAYIRSGGRCECTRLLHVHFGGRCNAPLTSYNTEFHHKTAQAVGGNDGLSNCEALCITCHRQTGSYGRQP